MKTNTHLTLCTQTNVSKSPKSNLNRIFINTLYLLKEPLKKLKNYQNRSTSSFQTNQQILFVDNYVLSSLKDRSKEENSDVVNQIKCNLCNSVYIGESDRELKETSRASTKFRIEI